MTTLAQKTDSETHNDIYIAGRDLAFVSDNQAYATVVEDVMRTLKGEIQLDLSAGVDYENTIWLNKSKAQDFKRSLIREVEKIDFVASVTDAVISFKTGGVVTAVLKIRLTNGDEITVEKNL